MFRIPIAILVSFNLHLVLANSKLKDFSSKLRSSTTIAKTVHTEFPFKAEISKEKISILRTAVLWHAPPYKSLAVKREPSEEFALDEKSMQILLNGLAAQNPSYAKLQKQNKAKFNHLLQIAGSVLGNNLPFVDLVAGQEFLVNSRESFEQINSNVNHYYQGFKEFYKPQINRDSKLVSLHETLQSKLEALCGHDSIAQVEALLSGGRW